LLRQALFERVDEARERPLVWVSGPPGAGKSTLIASYVGERECREAWYHVDAGDDEVGTFFCYLAQSVPPPSKRQAKLPLLTPEHRADLAGFSRHFFHQFFARRHEGTTAGAAFVGQLRKAGALLERQGGPTIHVDKDPVVDMSSYWTFDYKTGTLGIDPVDARTNSLAWQGIAKGKVSEKAARDSDAAVKDVVGEIFSNFPDQPR